MPERIVDRLEASDVEAENGNERVVFTRCDSGSQPLQQTRAVQRFGERIVESEIPDLGFGLRALGDVLDRAKVKIPLTAVIVVPLPLLVNETQRSIRPDDAVIDAVRALFDTRAEHFRSHALRIVRLGERPKALERNGNTGLQTENAIDFVRP